MERTADIRINVSESVIHDLSPAFKHSNHAKDIDDAIAYREGGGAFLSAEESLAMLRKTIERIRHDI